MHAREALPNPGPPSPAQPAQARPPGRPHQNWHSVVVSGSTAGSAPYSREEKDTSSVMPMVKLSLGCGCARLSYTACGGGARGAVRGRY